MFVLGVAGLLSICAIIYFTFSLSHVDYTPRRAHSVFYPSASDLSTSNKGYSYGLLFPSPSSPFFCCAYLQFHIARSRLFSSGPLPSPTQFCALLAVTVLPTYRYPPLAVTKSRNNSRLFKSRGLNSRSPPPNHPGSTPRAIRACLQQCFKFLS